MPCTRETVKLHRCNYVKNACFDAEKEYKRRLIQRKQEFSSKTNQNQNKIVIKTCFMGKPFGLHMCAVQVAIE